LQRHLKYHIMKKIKKEILGNLKNVSTKKSKKNVKFDNMVLNLALQKIDSDSFACDGKAVYSADKKLLIYAFAIDEDFMIPEGVETIGKMAFRNKKNLTNVVIPATVKVIEKEAFSGCERLDNVYVPATVESVKDSAFAQCMGLHSVVFAGLVKHLSRHAFDNCDNLGRITVPAGCVKDYRMSLVLPSSGVKDYRKAVSLVKEEAEAAVGGKADTKAAAATPKGNGGRKGAAAAKGATSQSKREKGAGK